MVPHRGANNAFFLKIMENHHKTLKNDEKKGSILGSTLGALLGALGPLLGGSGASFGRLLASLGGSWVVFGPPWAAQDRPKNGKKLAKVRNVFRLSPSGGLRWPSWPLLASSWPSWTPSWGLQGPPSMHFWNTFEKRVPFKAS